ncbi:hypothetical protein K470DRAFT_256745 [Piedraia hortae CBS 480.64]|uniref:Uncharacterized protein n=1 Tax=Piedraia hortae CBS 480.64 TaxID=1314780 RepID=A0A6A7C211_9PEZI|nr:hypothetical protein K470DRAFT_256745 [Piedraia hortae CBS 480.64]
MPVAHSAKHGTIIPDVVVAMSSLVTRQTNGQLYEAACALTHISMGSRLPVAVDADAVFDVNDEFTVTDATTGEPYMTAVVGDDGEIYMQETLATLGIVRMFNQTQMTRERHHVSHISHGAAPSAGLIGSLHDNECIDMCPGDNKDVPDLAARSFLKGYRGFICAGHTSHSTEAGRVRRVTCDVRVRLLSQHTIDDLLDVTVALRNISRGTDTDWTVFCMGYHARITRAEITCLERLRDSASIRRPCTFSVHIYPDSKLVVVSVSSGTLLKKCSDGRWADDVEVHVSEPVGGSSRPRVSGSGRDQLRANFSAFFSLVPFVSSGRAPRPLISSVQTPQAVCIPWCPGTASVSPCYSFDPVVTTQLYSEVLADIRNDRANASSYLPDENVVTLYLNLPGNYDDAMIVSRRRR